MEQNKWQLLLHEDCEDPFYEITNGQISLIAKCGFVGEDDADEENIFNRVKDELNTSGVRFHSGNKLEIKQHIEIQKQQYEIAALQSKCDRYESVIASLNNTRFIKGVPGATWGDTDYDSLAAAAGYNQAVMNMKSLILKSLTGEGEKEKPPAPPDFGICQRCKQERATRQYSDLYVCEQWDKMLNDEFDEEYR